MSICIARVDAQYYNNSDNIFYGAVELAIIAGIDEAGYGPILGPMVVARSVFQVPDSNVRGDLWKTLAAAVCKTRTGQKGRLLIADSKKVYNKTLGISQLERSVLCCAYSLADTHPDGFADAAAVIKSLCPKCRARLDAYPWYTELVDTKLDCDHGDITLASAVLLKACKAESVRVHDLGAKCFDVGHYNRMVESVRNKSAVLFTGVCEMIDTIVRSSPRNEQLHIVIDRQGGRTKYIPSLEKMFPAGRFKAVVENEKISSYELTMNDRMTKVHFCVKADDRHMPVALASMTAKYVRELLIGAINGYFIKYIPEIKPTAGYWTDGQRFIKDIGPHIKRLNVKREMLIRSR